MLLVVNVRIKKKLFERIGIPFCQRISLPATRLANFGMNSADRLKSITKLATFKKQLKALLANDEGTYFNL